MMKGDMSRVLDEPMHGDIPMRTSNIQLTGRKLFLESYGCAMNFSDSEIVASILSNHGISSTNDFREADIIFLNTCAIRDNAEQKIRTRLQDFKSLKKKNPALIVGVLGCMAGRLKSKLLDDEKLVDIVVGPDAYRDLPSLIETVDSGQKAVNVILSKEETYADITPLRLASNGVSAFISITRGCDNMCSFCVVPFTRGRERSRDPDTIIAEATNLFEQGYREITLLGQNVDSYLWTGGGLKKENPSAAELKNATGFALLLEKVALINPLLRVRFSTSNPRDMTDDVIHTISRHENICNYIHLPVQSGNNRILEMMNRGYTREWYMSRIEAIKRIIPDCGLSTDIITGFCSETEEEHLETISLMEWVGYDFSYLFKYSERPKTMAERKFRDDIPEEVKSGRLQEIITIQQKLSYEKTRAALNKVHRVLIEGLSKKSDKFLSGRNQQNTVVVFPKGNQRPGEYADIRVTSCTPATLIGEAI